MKYIFPNGNLSENMKSICQGKDSDQGIATSHMALLTFYLVNILYVAGPTSELFSPLQPKPSLVQ
jgi:hypothetical protein